MQKEAAIIIGSIEAVILPLIALISRLLGWDAELTSAVIAVVGPTVALIGALLTRGRVYSEATVERLLKEQDQG